MSGDLPAPEASPGLPAPDARHGEPEPATVAELAEDLARTAEEQAVLDALADNPDGQAMEMLLQHLRHLAGPLAEEPPVA
jgi:hypothetical protein